ncbi:Protein saf4 [Didymosphaeria variabile]|uniref:Protein saf4 n=1 Tax=Didymosphaeria variabile TaxID=1932322 RepID=A0A9W8XHM3_9PLEO|nr:Protein saf4 [Didymosphaeria variabile]KAJ4350443.1 Protein saf4 [Didymosphaeria variabile]
MQGFNMGRYYPPDASNAPTFNTSNPLGSRAKKGGALVVRFELPFAVWCSHCTPPAIVGQGVRFNAEKKKAGNYYSTPIWSFRMKHTACGGWWEIRTDPKNAEGRNGGITEKRSRGGEMKFLSEEEREKRRTDAFARFEGKVEEKGEQRGHAERIEELYDKAEVWRDPYDVNAKLRREFREKRRGWKKEDRLKEGMQEKFSFGYEIADGTETDDMRAKLVDFGASTLDDGVEEAVRKPLFTSVKAAMTETVSKKKLKSEIAAEKSRQNLQQSLAGNTRASIDPFLSAEAKSSTKLSLGIKRKRNEDGSEDQKTQSPATKSIIIDQSTEVPTKRPTSAAALVDYDSD